MKIRVFIAVTTLIFSLGAQATPPFRLTLSSEPGNIDPHQQKGSISSYLLQSLYRNLFFYDDDAGLVPDLGESCKRDGPLVLVCKLKNNLKWSDGSALTAADFLKSYQRILDPKNASPRADLLFKIKNAAAIYKDPKKMSALGITAPNATTLRFEFGEKDPDFEYVLANSLVSPIKNTLAPGPKATELVVNGPYKISQWISGQKIQLVSNDFYPAPPSVAKSPRPPVEFLFVAEDSVGLQLYEKNELSFLRRLPSLYIPQFKSRPDFLWIPVTRFDYIGFGPALKDHPKLREALSLSLAFPELQKIFASDGVPGCAGTPQTWTTEELCYKKDLIKAKAALAQDKNSPKTMQLMYSTLGGEDHRRATEWIQSQWSQNLNISVQIVLRENKVYLSELQKNPPAIFRKGVAPDRPTCLAVLETFASWSPENYIQMKNPEFQTLLKTLSETSSPDARKKLCTRGIRYLMEDHWIIPMGAIHFAMLAKPEFKGWKLNSMNQLNLSGLEYRPAP
jgi:oligopeptide transport system substrate-binding protein